MAETVSAPQLSAGAPAAKQQPGADAVQVYTPRLSVILRKVINRKSSVAENVAAGDRVTETEGTAIDLTDFLAVGSMVTVRRTVRGSDSGQFSISFPDDMDPVLLDSIYGLVEPQDVIEIRMARDPAPYAGGLLPIVLRGFVSEVSRTPDEMTDSGPVRGVVITGQDYSKVLNIIRFIYLPTMIPAQQLLSSYKLFLNYGVESTGFESPAAFVQKIVGEVVGEYLSKMRQGSGGDMSPIERLAVDATDSSSAGSIQPFGVQEWSGGSVHDLLMLFGDVGAWNELYVEDRDSGPTVVYRPTPFKTAAGEYIQGGAAADQVRVTQDDVIAMPMSRSDADVANYYWVDAPRLNLLQNPLLQLDQQLAPSPALEGYQNSNPLIYGIRLMRESTNQGIRYDGKAEAEVEAGEGIVIEMVNEKRRVLIENNKDNTIFERGTITLKGSEKIRAGCYITVQRGGFEASYYATEITHQFAWGGSFTTVATVERGTGYIERLKRGEANAPYLSELTLRGAYG